MGFHWFGRIRFLAEAAGVLEPRQPVCDPWLQFHQALLARLGCQGLESWFRETYFPHYLLTARNEESATPSKLELHGPGSVARNAPSIPGA